MALGALRRYDVQAKWAACLSATSIVPFLGACWLVVTRYQPDLRQIVYGAEGRFLSAFLGCLLLSIVPAGVAFLLGLSSAGQRRNDRPGRAWLGFFLGGFIATMNIVLLLAFWFLRLEKPA